MRRLALTLALLSLSLPALAQESMPAPPQATATAPTLGAPAEGMAQIVFFRPSKFAGSAVIFKVREGETELGKLKSGRYFIVDTSPGSHSYVVHSEAKDVLDLEVDAGETYYVMGSIGMGVLAARPNLSPSDQAAFAAALKKMKRSASEADMAAQAAADAAG